MEDCLFCKIIAGDIPANKVYEDGDIIAFLDIKPVNPGHTLVVPKTHIAALADATGEQAAEVMRMVPEIARAIMKATGSPAFNLHVNNGEEAGQVVHHLHLHIIPRLAEDGYSLWHSEKDLTPDEGKQLADSIRLAFA